jgi:NADH:ubiquinone oxidoreductase subunit K
MTNSIHILVSILLFSIGLAVVLSKKNIIFLLIGIELMLNAANLNFIYFSQFNPDASKGHFYVLLVMMLAASETAIGLAIALKVRKYFNSINPDDLDEIKDLG